MIRRLPVLIAVLLLPACTLLPPLQDNQQQFVVGKLPPVSKEPRKNRQLVIMHPTTDAVYDTARMAWSPRQWEISYFAKNRWGDKPADMLQNLLIRTFEATHAFTAVSKSPLPGSPAVILRSNIIRFDEDLTGPQPVFRFVLHIELHQNGAAILGAREFSATEPVITQTPYGVVLAANQAVSRTLQDVEKYCIHKIHKKGRSQ